MKDLVRNVNPEKHCAQVQQIVEKLTKLQTKYKHFKEALEENCKNDGRSTMGGYKNILMLASGVTMVAGFLLATAFLIIHFVPGINAVLTPIGWGVVAASTVGSVAAGTVL